MLCHACLSEGRKLKPLGTFSDIYTKITAEFDYPNFSYIFRICWECQSVLRKVLLFQKRVKKAYYLQLQQNHITSSLSNLTSVILNATHQTICLSDNYMHSKKQVDCVNKANVSSDILSVCMNNESNYNVNPSEHLVFKSHNAFPKLKNLNAHNGTESLNSHNINKCVVKHKPMQIANVGTSQDDNYLMEHFCEKPLCNSIDLYQVKTVTLLEKKITSNNLNVIPISRWALKRSKENKKPKFKIISKLFDDMFQQIQIGNVQLENCVLRDKDSEYYKSKKFKCEICILGFPEENYLNIHNKILHTARDSHPYTCDICKAGLQDKRILTFHIMQHYYIHKCTVCPFICRSKDHMIWHFQRTHKKSYQCLKCRLIFSSRREFFQHYKQWHQKFICDHCGISFKMRYCIKDHIRKQHSPFSCTLCNKTFARYNGLWLHRKLAHTPIASPAYCVECDTVYKDIYRYKWHLSNSPKHTPKRKLTFPCPHCDKTYTKKIYMKEHFNLVHLGLFNYRCEECDKNFIRNADLVKHKRRIHEGILPPKNKICYVCGQGFSTNKILHYHVLTHTGERPYACGLCSARYTQQHALQAHVRLRHTDQSMTSVDLQDKSLGTESVTGG